MKIKTGNIINAGDLVSIKFEDYKAACPSGEALGFSLQNNDDIPFGLAVVVDDETHLVSKDSGAEK